MPLSPAPSTSVPEDVQRALEERLAFERLLADLSASLVSAAPGRVRELTEHWIPHLVAFLRVDRGTLLGLSEDGRSLINLYSYAVPPAEPARERILGGGLPWVTSKLRAGRTLFFRRLEEFPAAAAEELEYVQGTGLRSNLTIPLAGEGTVFGALAFSAFRERDWPDEVIQRVQLVGQVFAAALLRARAHEDLARSREAYRDLSDKLLLAQEGERRRIARELHDDIHQRLALLSIRLDQLAARDGEPAAVHDEVAELGREIKELLADLHRISHGLHASKLEQLGLVPAVRGLCRDLGARFGVEIAFAEDESVGQVGTEVARCLYRVTQEALHNVVKHSGAPEASVVLTGDPEALELTVTDAGVGFDPADLGDRGLGLVSMRERVRMGAGRFVIESAPGAGTRIRVRLPRRAESD